MTASLQQVTALLNRFGVEYIVIGGWAAALHGSARSTVDVDIVYRRTTDNIQRLARCLQTVNAYLRGAPPGLPFQFDERTVQAGLNFTLTTDVGDIDCLGEVAGGGRYEELMPYTEEIHGLGVTLRCVTLERLIQLKRAAGRPKDLEILAELQALLEQRHQQSSANQSPEASGPTVNGT